MAWTPTRVRRVARILETSTRVAQVETDVGSGYIKTAQNPEGPHTLACELIGTRVAQWLRLPTLEWSVIQLSAADATAWPEDGAPRPGPAYITREVSGHPWGGTQAELRRIENAQDLVGLVVLDTWLLNCDRYRESDPVRRRERNVFFSWEAATPSKIRALAIDHTHCFTCGKELRARRLSNIDLILSDEVFGLFPEFKSLVTHDTLEPFMDRLDSFSAEDAAGIVADVPDEWGWSPEIGRAMGDFLVRRAAFLAAHLPGTLGQLCDLELRFNFRGAGND